MEAYYIDPESNAIADLVMDTPGTYIITRINVPAPYRGRGIGSRLLDQILADADVEPGIILYLQPSPSGGLGLRALIQWYKRRGFRWSSTLLFMVRYPNSRTTRRPPSAG